MYLGSRPYLHFFPCDVDFRRYVLIEELRCACVVFGYVTVVVVSLAYVVQLDRAHLDTCFVPCVHPEQVVVIVDFTYKLPGKRVTIKSDVAQMVKS